MCVKQVKKVEIVWWPGEELVCRTSTYRLANDGMVEVRYVDRSPVHSLDSGWHYAGRWDGDAEDFAGFMRRTEGCEA